MGHPTQSRDNILQQVRASEVCMRNAALVSSLGTRPTPRPQLSKGLYPPPPPPAVRCLRGGTNGFMYAFA